MPDAQAGLSPRLRTLVDCEALLNDGSAYVLFYLLRVRLHLLYNAACILSSICDGKVWQESALFGLSLIQHAVPMYPALETRI